MSRNSLLACFLGLAISGIGAAANLDAPDTSFVRKAAEGDMAEIKLAQLAQTKASSRAVKDFAARMIQDHTQNQQQVNNVASQDGVSLSGSMNAKDRALYDRLSNLSGTQFDKAYMNAMIQDHEQDVSEFRRESKNAKNSGVRQFASNTLPILEQHLQLAKQTGSNVGAMSSNGQGTSAQR